jgi:DNA invertase Pin-like site-specific DNA recombinase
MARVSRKQRTAAQAPSVSPAVRIWKAALYVRLSVEDNGRDSDSVENQIALLEKYVGNHPALEKAALFVDNGYTGTDFLRPEYIRMMDAVQSGMVDCIVVKDLSRLGRNYIETSQFIEKICPLYGLRFIAVNDGYDTATVTSEGQLSASLANIVNDYYAKDISRKVTTALQAKMERGDYIGNYAPYGYQKDPVNKNRLLIDSETAPVIRQIFQWRSEGVSYMGINKRLNEAGIASPSQRKANQGVVTNNNQKSHTILWNRHMIKEILSNVVYLGHLAQRRTSQNLCAGLPFHRTEKAEWIVVKDTHQPLVSEELFEAVQHINQETANRHKANSGKYDLLPKEKNIYGKKFTCARCGATMKLQRSFSTKRDKVYFTFKCPTYAEHGSCGCSNVKIRKADLDQAVFAHIRSQMDVFLDVENSLHTLLEIKKADLNQTESQREIAALRQKLSHKQSLLAGLYVDLKDGFLSQEDYVGHREIMARDIASLQTHLNELETVQEENEGNLAAGTRWKVLIQRFYEAESLTTEMVDAFIESMQLNADGSLSITLSYMDELSTLASTCERLRKEVA